MCMPLRIRGFYDPHITFIIPYIYNYIYIIIVIIIIIIISSSSNSMSINYHHYLYYHYYYIYIYVCVCGYSLNLAGGISHLRYVAGPAPQVNHRQANEMVDQIRLSRVGSIFNGVGVKEPVGISWMPGMGSQGLVFDHAFRPGILGLRIYIYNIHIYNIHIYNIHI